MAAKAQIPDLKQFLESKDKQRGAAAPPSAPAAAPAAKGAPPDLKQFLEQKEAARKPASASPSNLATWAHSDPVHDYLFGKKQAPVDPSAPPMLRSVDRGAVGRGLDKLESLPTGPGSTRTLGDVDRQIVQGAQGVLSWMQHPLGMTEGEWQTTQQHQSESLKRHIGRGEWVASPLLTTVEEQASPMNVALLAGFGAMGGGVQSAGVRTLSKMAEIYWASQAGAGAVEGANASLDAFRKGDYEGGVRAAVGGLVSLAFAKGGVSHLEAQQHVVDQIHAETKAQHPGKKFEALTPQEKARVVYGAAQKEPATAEMASEDPKVARRAERDYDAFLHHARSQGFGEAVEPVAAPNSSIRAMTPTPETLRWAGDHAEVMRNQIQRANNEARFAAMPKPEKRPHQAEPTLLNVPVFSPEERENILYEKRKAEAMATIERERAAEHQRKDAADQMARDMEARTADSEQETAARAAREGSGFKVEDRRSEVAQQILAEVSSQKDLGRQLYDDHIAALSKVTDGMGFRDTERAASMIRAKRQRGEALSADENTVLSMHARREEMLEQMAARYPRARRVLDEHTARLNEETATTVIDLTTREHSLREAAASIEDQAKHAETPMAADLMAQQAVEAREMAEKVQTQRSQAQSEQAARSEAKKVVPRAGDISTFDGRATSVHLPDGRELGARYAAAKLSDLQLSHDPFSFEWNPKYEPRRMQPRDLSTNDNAKAAILVDSKPENYRLERYATDNPTGLEGPAVVLPDGRVAGGNSRLSRLTRRLAEGDGKAVAFELWNQMAKFGIVPEGEFDGNDPYIPVRVLDDVPEATQDLIQLGDDLNRDFIMGFTVEEQGAMSADRMTQEDVDQISNMMEQMPGDPSLRDVLRHRGQQVVDMMIDRGMIPANKRAEYLTSGGEMTERAKGAFEAAIRGKVIDDPELLATSSPDILNRLDRVLGSLLRLKAAGGTWDIGDYVKQSMRAWKQIESVRSSLNLIGKATDSIVDKFYSPEEFKMGTPLMSFGEEEVRPKPHPVAYALVKAFNESSIKFKKAFQDYAAPAEGMQSFLVAPPEPYEVFNDTIGKLAGVEVHPASWGTVEEATPERKTEVDRLIEPQAKPTVEEKAAARKMTVPPNVEIAAAQVLSAAKDGTVTPESLRGLFAENPSTAKHADMLMEVLGRIVPNATGMPLGEFLGRHMADVQAGGEFSGGLAQSGDVAPTWYLKSEQLIADKMRGPMDGAGLRKMLLNGGVKADEMKWTGLDDYLRDRKRVTPAEVKQYLSENNIKVEETMLGGAPRKLPTSGMFGDTEISFADDTETVGPGGVTKYGRYQMPGGENYREMLLTLPEMKTPEQTASLRAIDEEYVPLAKEWRQLNEETTLDAYRRAKEAGGAAFEAMQAKAKRLKEVEKLQDELLMKQQKIEHELEASGFRSGHWEERNILAHIRFNERTTPEGKKLLHLEEVQSDWHQKGRSKGYRGDYLEQLPEVLKRFDEAEARSKDLQEQFRAARNEHSEHIKATGNTDPALEEREARLHDEYMAAQKQVGDLNLEMRRLRSQSDRVPDAPFKKTWHEMALRRMLRYAAENGYDGVSWTPGEKQAERYDLSKQISSVRYATHADPTYPKQHSLVALDHNGQAVYSGWHKDPSEFEGIIGKEVTKRLIEATPSRLGVRQLSTFDLKIGGEGMKGFYDRIIPDYLRSYGKRWGAKVGEVELGGGGVVAHYISDGVPQTTRFESEEQAEAFKRRRNDAEAGDVQQWKIDKAPDGSRASAIQITAEMRRSVMEEGQPLFQKENQTGANNIKKGATKFLDDGRALVQVFEHGDVSTVLHEFTHVMRSFLADDGDKAALERFAGVEHGIWDTPAEEKVARGFEKYMHEGVAPAEELEPLFAKLKNVFRKIYGYIRNGEYKLPKSAPINIKLSKEVRETFDRWFTGTRELAPTPEDLRTEPVPSAASMEMALTPEEREGATLVSNGGHPLADRMSESRVKRFWREEDANAWVINNVPNLHGVEVWKMADGQAFAQFIPKGGKQLFQEESLREMIQKMDTLRTLVREETNPHIAERMRAEINRLEAKSGIRGDMILGATPESGKGMIGSTEPRPPLQVKLLFGGDDAGTDRPRRVSDDAVPLPNAGAARSLAEQPERSAVGRADGRAGDGRGDGGRGATGPAGGRVRPLQNVRAAELAAPERVRGAATVEPAKWAARMTEMRMPEGLPAPTVRLDDDLTRLLIYPGQPEVVESTLSALDQFDGSIIATPTGTGKSYSLIAIAKQMMRRGQADRVLVLTKNDSIINGERGLKAIAKNTFAMEMKDLPAKIARDQKGFFVATYSTLRNRPEIVQNTWDLVLYDEAAEMQNWQESEQGKAGAKLNEVAKKAVYVSATTHSTALEMGYMGKLGLWKPGEFAKWARQFGVREGKNGTLTGGNEPKMLLKLREQLVERGQFVTQEKSMEGVTAHFAQVPLTAEQHGKMRETITAMKQAAKYYDMRNKPAMAKAVRGNMATFVKSYLERSRLPETIEVAKKLRAQGWDVIIFSETRSKVDKMYDFLNEANEASGGELSRAMPKLPGVYEELSKAFGSNAVANFSGEYSAAREAEMKAFSDGQKRILFATYGAGGVGVSLHDEQGSRPRAAIYLGPPWSGKMFDQAMGRTWRYGAKSNVMTVLMTSNAMPETRMMLTKVGPRLESLRAAVNGVIDDPTVTAIRESGQGREELAKYEMGGGNTDGRTAEQQVDDLLQLDNRVLLGNYKDLRVPSAEMAKNKGMKYPGEGIRKPGVITLFQADGSLVVPDRFRTPDEGKGRKLNEEIAQTLADGGNLPGVGDGLSDFEPGVRRQIADMVGPQVQDILDEGEGDDPEAMARIVWASELTKIHAAKLAGDISVNPDVEKGPAWEMRSDRITPEGLAAPAGVEPEGNKKVNPAIWTLSGRQNFLRITRQAGVPEIGFDLKRDHDDYFVTRANIAGDFQSRVLEVLHENGITPKEDRILFRVKEGLLPAPNERIAKAAEGLTKLFNEARQTLGDLGYTGTYFEDGKQGEFNYSEMPDDPRYAPHYFDPSEKIRLKSPKTGQEQVFTLNELLGKSLSDTRKEAILTAIGENTGMSRTEIETFLDRKRRRVPLAGSLDRARQADLPFYRMDRNVWLEYGEQYGSAVARTKVFGQDREKLTWKIGKVPSVDGQKTINTIFDGVLAKMPWNEDMGKWYSRWGTAMVLSKMTFSPVKVPFHMAHASVLLQDNRSLMYALFKGVTSYKDAHDVALSAGVLVDQMKAATMMEHAAGAKAANAMLKYTGFHWLYKFDRIMSANATQNWMEARALPKLIKKARRSEHIRYQLKEKMLLSDAAIDAAIERGRWTREDLNRGAAAFTNRTLFTTSPAELGPAWRARSTDPIMDKAATHYRVMTLLKGFTFKTAMFVKEDIVDEARRGNFRPLMYAAMAYPIVGDMLKATSAGVRSVVPALTGNFNSSPEAKYLEKLQDLFEHPTAAKVAQRLLDDIGEAVAMQMLTEVIDAVAFACNAKSKRAAKFKGQQVGADTAYYMLGPYADVAKSALAAIEVSIDLGASDTRAAGKKTKEWLEEEIPALRGVFPDDKAKGNASGYAPP